MLKKLSYLSIALAATNLFAMEEMQSPTDVQSSRTPESYWLSNLRKIQSKLSDFLELEILSRQDIDSNVEENNDEEADVKSIIGLIVLEVMKTLPKNEMNKDLDQKQFDDLFEKSKEMALRILWNEEKLNALVQKVNETIKSFFNDVSSASQEDDLDSEENNNKEN
ncbi:hypothetical protein M1446_03435 [Candidatus Dependentiae bacterium]|nr:hypothetical protein [Candidatus Dependentiae bacterium]